MEKLLVSPGLGRYIPFARKQIKKLKKLTSGTFLSKVFQINKVRVIVKTDGRTDTIIITGRSAETIFFVAPLQNNYFAMRIEADSEGYKLFPLDSETINRIKKRIRVCGISSTQLTVQSAPGQTLHVAAVPFVRHMVNRSAVMGRDSSRDDWLQGIDDHYVIEGLDLYGDTYEPYCAFRGVGSFNNQLIWTGYGSVTSKYYDFAYEEYQMMCGFPIGFVPEKFGRLGFDRARNGEDKSNKYVWDWRHFSWGPRNFLIRDEDYPYDVTDSYFAEMVTTGVHYSVHHGNFNTFIYDIERRADILADSYISQRGYDNNDDVARFMGVYVYNILKSENRVWCSGKHTHEIIPDSKKGSIYERLTNGKLTKKNIHIYHEPEIDTTGYSLSLTDYLHSILRDFGDAISLRLYDFPNAPWGFGEFYMRWREDNEEYGEERSPDEVGDWKRGRTLNPVEEIGWSGYYAAVINEDITLRVYYGQLDPFEEGHRAQLYMGDQRLHIADPLTAPYTKTQMMFYSQIDIMDYDNIIADENYLVIFFSRTGEWPYFKRSRWLSGISQKTYMGKYYLTYRYDYEDPVKVLLLDASDNFKRITGVSCQATSTKLIYTYVEQEFIGYTETVSKNNPDWWVRYGVQDSYAAVSRDEETRYYYHTRLWEFRKRVIGVVNLDPTDKVPLGHHQQFVITEDSGDTYLDDVLMKKEKNPYDNNEFTRDISYRFHYDDISAIGLHREPATRHLAEKTYLDGLGKKIQWGS